VSALFWSWEEIIVKSSVIAFFAHVHKTVSTKKGTLHGALGGSVCCPIAFLIRVDDSITAAWEFTIGSACIWESGISWSIIALLSTINNSVTNTRETTQQTAVIRLGIRVHGWSIIAFFSKVCIDDTVVISAEEVSWEGILEVSKELGSLGSTGRNVEENSKDSI